MLKATERLERLVSMVPWLIENNGATVEDLASRFQYPRETLINDLTKVLFFVGPHPHTPDNLIEVDVHEEEVWISQANYLSRPLKLTYPEAFSLLAKGKILLTLINENTQESSLTTALEKLGNYLGAKSEQILIDPGVRGSEIYALIASSIKNQKKIYITYYSFNEDYSSRRLVNPIRIGLNDRYLYLYAYCEKADDYRTFRIDRITHGETTEEKIEQAHMSDPMSNSEKNPIHLDFQFPTNQSATLSISKSDDWIVSKYPTISVEEKSNNRLEVMLPVASNTWLGRLILLLEEETLVVKCSQGVSKAAGYDLATRILNRYGLNE